MASSLIDAPLDELVSLNQSKRGRGRGRGRGWFPSGQRQWSSNKPGSKGPGRGRAITRYAQRDATDLKVNGLISPSAARRKNIVDLRDVIVGATKTKVVDLRSKLQPKTKSPKSASWMKGSTANDRAISRGRPTQAPQVYLPPKSRSMSYPRGITRTAPSRGMARSSSTGYGVKLIFPANESRTPKLPSETEAKKITVTVAGRSKTTSEVYKREERLAAAMLRQKESRHQSYMRSREALIASSITTAFTGGERERQPIYHHKLYNRPPSPAQYADGYETFHPPAPQVVVPVRPRGLTTVTTLIISNLSDTVSKNDVAELCSAVGPVENVVMPLMGVAEVTFRYKDDALEAYRKYNQRNLDGMPMICRIQSGPSRALRAAGPVLGRFSGDVYAADLNHTSGLY